MHDELWCPEGHEAREPTPAGPSSALCACGARFSTRPGVQAAYRAEAGVEGASPVAVQGTGPERVGALPGRRPQTTDDATHALVLAAWPEPGPRAILSTPPHDAPAGAWTDDEINAPPQLPEGNEPEADRASKLGAEAAPVVEPPPTRPQDILDWLAHGPDA